MQAMIPRSEVLATLDNLLTELAGELTRHAAEIVASQGPERERHLAAAAALRYALDCVRRARDNVY